MAQTSLTLTGQAQRHPGIMPHSFLLWEPLHGRAQGGRPHLTYVDTPRADTGLHSLHEIARIPCALLSGILPNLTVLLTDSTLDLSTYDYPVTPVLLEGKRKFTNQSSRIRKDLSCQTLNNSANPCFRDANSKF